MRFKELIEYRRNPEKNVKSVSGHHEAIDFLKSVGVTSDDKTSNWGVSMTELPKLGINPLSRYEATPLGVYFYPAWYYIKVVGGGGRLPFQHSADFIQVFQYDESKAFDIENYTGNDFDRDVNKLNQLYDKNKVNYIVNDDGGSDGASKLWRVLKQLAYELSNGPNTKIKINSSISTIKWNKIFRKLGYELAIDNSDKGVIHSYEPTQGVIFNPRIIKSVKTIVNKLEMSPELAYNIALRRGTRIPDLEKIIIKDPEYIQYYARNVIEGRWHEAEPIIATNAQYSFQYAEQIIHGRFKLGEEAISNDFYHSYYYAKDIIGGRFPLAEQNCYNEQNIKNSRNMFWFDSYIKMLKQRDINVTDLENR